MSLQQIIKAENVNPILEYNRQNAEQISKLCSPLLECFGITSFGYFRAFDDGKYLLLSNDSLLIETLTTKDLFYRTDHFKTMLAQFCRYNPVRDCWPELGADDSINILKDHGCNFTGYNIVREREGCLEAAMFSHPVSEKRMDVFYQKHQGILDDFVSRFKTIGHQLCDANNESKLGTSDNLRELYPKIDSIFMTSTPWERQIESFNNHMDALVQQEIHDIARAHSITLKELQCLSYFTAHKSAKEIARIMDVSPRTIEKHLDNIRLKTGLHTRQELIHWFEDRFGHVFTKDY